MLDDLSLLSSLMNCRAVSSEILHVNRAMEVMEGYLRENGVFCSVEIIGGRKVLYASTCPGKGHDFVFNTHIDVVPAPDSMFQVTRDGDKIFGRGVDDDQGAAVCVAQLLIKLAGRGSVGAIFTADEEIGGKTTAGMIGLGYGPRKMGLVVDGPSYGLVVKEKGIVVLKLTAHGHSAHSSTPWDGVNPIDLLIDGYLRLRQAWPEVRADDQWHNTMAPCVLRAGDVENQIPDDATMIVNVRYVDDEDRDKIVRQAEELTGLDVTVYRECRPVSTDENNPLIKSLYECMATHFPDKNVCYARMNGATDARHMVELNVPLAIFGLGGGNCHALDEWADLRSIGRMADMLLDFILQN